MIVTAGVFLLFFFFGVGFTQYFFILPVFNATLDMCEFIKLVIVLFDIAKYIRILLFELCVRVLCLPDMMASINIVKVYLKEEKELNSKTVFFKVEQGV